MIGLSLSLRPLFYVLVEHVAVPEPDPRAWSRWMATAADRRVAQTLVGKLRISTVFLGLDHGWGGGPPMLFETMIFSDGRGSDDIYCERCSTWEEAEKMHATAIRWAEENV